MSNYVRLFLMVGTSVLIMYGLTYLNSFEIRGHAYFSETRVFMALMMGMAMIAVMMAFMPGMYRNPVLNIAVAGAAAVVFAGALWLVRSQATVDDVDYMEAMIPHHSIAILTSRRADITDPRVRALSDAIIEAQLREIAEMKALIADLEGRSGAPPKADGQ